MEENRPCSLVLGAQRPDIDLIDSAGSSPEVSPAHALGRVICETTMGEVVLQDHFRRFQTHAERRIAHLRDASALPEDPRAEVLDRAPAYVCALHGWRDLASCAPAEVLDTLNAWRNARMSKMVEGEEVPVEIVYVESVWYAAEGLAQLSALDKHLSDPFKRKVSQKEKGQLEILMQNALGFLKRMGEVTHKSLFKKLSSAFSPQSDRFTAHRKFAHRLWSFVLGNLSRFRFEETFKAISSFVDSANSLYSKDMGLFISTLAFEAMKYFQIDRYNLSNDLNLRFLKRMIQFFEKFDHSRETQQAICSSLASIIYPGGSFDRNDSCSIEEWKSLMSACYEQMFSWCIKTKNLECGIGLLTSCLCASDDHFFLSHLLELIEILVDILRRKLHRKKSLSCIHRLIFVYLNFIQGSKDNSLSIIKSIAEVTLFSKFTKLSFTDGSYQEDHDGILAIVITLCEGSPRLAFDHIINPFVDSLMSLESDSSLSESVRLLLRTFLAITHRSEEAVRIFVSEPWPNSLYPSESPSIAQCVTDVKAFLACHEHLDISGSFGSICGLAEYILSKSQLLLSGPSSETKEQALLAHKMCLFLLPFMLDHLKQPELIFSIVCKGLMQDEVLSQAASFCLNHHHLMVHPTWFPLAIQSLISTIAELELNDSYSCQALLVQVRTLQDSLITLA